MTVPKFSLDFLGNFPILYRGIPRFLEFFPVVFVLAIMSLGTPPAIATICFLGTGFISPGNFAMII